MKSETQPSGATATKPALITIPPVETHLLRSETIKQTFKIQVQRPPRMAGQPDRFPVVYVTDANLFFDMCRDLSLSLQTAQEAPPFILVGIGYPSDALLAGYKLRWREFTFPPYPQCDPNACPDFDEDQLVPEEGAKNFYGGEDFRQFIKENLIPFIDAKYATVPDNRTYFGYSGGGFFALFTLFTDPSLFKNYICGSPGLLMHGVTPGGFAYDNYDCGGLLVRDFIASGKSLDGIKLYMSMGEDEENVVWKMVQGFYDMLKSLKTAAIPGLQVMSELLPAESHITGVPNAFVHGVQAVFGTRRIVHSFSN